MGTSTLRAGENKVMDKESEPTGRKRILGILVALSTITGLTLSSAPSAAAASNVNVTVGYQGNACYVWGQSLSKWKAVITGANGYSTAVTVNNGWRYANVSVPGGSSYNVRIQSWCSGIFLGKSASGNRWAYSSGYQPAWTFYAGVWTG